MSPQYQSFCLKGHAQPCQPLNHKAFLQYSTLTLAHIIPSLRAQPCPPLSHEAALQYSTQTLAHNTLSLRAQPYPPFSHEAALHRLFPITPSLPKLNHIHHSAMKHLLTGFFPYDPLY